VEVKLIDKGITVAEDYIAGTVHVEYDNTDSILPLKNRIIDWWRRADDNYEAIEIYEIKDRHKWIDNQKLMKVGKAMENLITRHLEEEANG
tara:strand:- start:1 stop:273 length:273 start_codon:yes stop_codon:yes gene_type:complete